MDVINLDNPGAHVSTTFESPARGDAMLYPGTPQHDSLSCVAPYPKKVDVSAVIALSRLRFDDTCMALISDPKINTNIRKIWGAGDFGGS